MSKKFRDELKVLEEDVSGMGALASGMLRDSFSALKKGDGKLAAKVVSKNADIEEMDERIEDDALKLIALYQPMARDMRSVAISLKMITYIARIGKYAKDIAVHARFIAERGENGVPAKLSEMAEAVFSMIDEALGAYRTRDVSRLSDFGERDDKVDAMFSELMNSCETSAFKKKISLAYCVDYLMVARYFERCGDHACKMAEKVHYMVTGERIDFNRPRAH